MKSDFSRGSAFTNGSVKLKPGPSKKLENLGSPDIRLTKSISSKLNTALPKSDDLTPLDDPSKSLSLALMDLKGKNYTIG